MEMTIYLFTGATTIGCLVLILAYRRLKVQYDDACKHGADIQSTDNIRLNDIRRLISEDPSLWYTKQAIVNKYKFLFDAEDNIMRSTYTKNKEK